MDPTFAFPKLDLPLRLLNMDGTLALIHATGTDVDAFLQGQLSSDLRKLHRTQAQLSSWNSPKGRMLVAPLLIRTESGILLELPRELQEPLIKRLRMYVLRSNVALQPWQPSGLLLIGTGSTERLQRVGLPCPVGPLAVAEGEGLIVVRRHAADCFRLIGTAEALAQAAARLGLEPIPESGEWTLSNIVAGVPQIGSATQDHFVPQMANLDLLGGIGFDKGCYTGQEIVARLHYLGQLKRRMFLCRGDGQPPAAGAPVHETGDQAVGEIVEAAAWPGGGFVASVVLQLGYAESGQLRTGATGLNLPLPYPYMPAIVPAG